ncbi:hypothetical protein NPIL_308961 [Nephila pilipes]|uniref:Uncharacterized protein n=1 Tax=Nephila pilipes TaxID=299642 RepID=A0A8X6TZV8_NEPPI|nr:hypothetical protein NPIL_308961 [Nephila pilipes]
MELPVREGARHRFKSQVWLHGYAAPSTNQPRSLLPKILYSIGRKSRQSRRQYASNITHYSIYGSVYNNRLRNILQCASHTTHAAHTSTRYSRQARQRHRVERDWQKCRATSNTARNGTRATARRPTIRRPVPLSVAHPDPARVTLKSRPDVLSPYAVARLQRTPVHASKNALRAIGVRLSLRESRCWFMRYEGIEGSVIHAQVHVGQP